MTSPRTRIALIGDTHNNTEALAVVLADIAKHPVDAVLFTGDMSDNLPAGRRPSESDVYRAHMQIYRQVEQAWTALGEEIPVYTVLGNHDPLPETSPSALMIHGRVVEVNGLRIAGLAGSSVKFGWPGEWRMKNPFPDGERADVLLAHAPPPGPRARTRTGEDAGERAVRDTALALGAKTVLCGHIHEARGHSKAYDAGNLLYDEVNAGALGRPYSWTGWVDLELDGPTLVFATFRGGL